MTHPTAKLGDVAEFIRGITFKPDDVVAVDADDAVVCMRTKNVQALLDCDDLLAVPSQFVRRKDQYLEEGDILVSSANSWNLVGKCCWIPSLPWRAAFGGFVSVLRGDSARVHRRYLYWWFASDRIQALLRSFGQKTTNISNLNIDRCLQLDLPLPPLSEQRRIAAILDKADALRTKRREALAQLDRLAQAIFLDMFGDPATNPKRFPARKLGEIIKFEGGAQPPASTFSDSDGPDKIRLIQIRDFKSDRFKTFIPRSLAKRFLEVDDVMIGRYGPPVFQILRGLAGSYNVALMKAVPREGLTKEFVFRLLKEERLHRFVVANSERTAGQSGVNLNLLEGYDAYLPPIELQELFGRQMLSLSSMQTGMDSALRVTEEMFSSLQHRAFHESL